MLDRRHTLALLGASAFTAIAKAQGAAAELIQVATFEQQVTGVAVARDGRIFVNFPRWEQDVELSVAEVMRDGRLTPYPNAEWNAWRIQSGRGAAGQLPERHQGEPGWANGLPDG